MINFKYQALIILGFAILTSCNSMNKKSNKIKYPEAKKDSVVDNYFGTLVSDPYRWLEDDNSKATLHWVDAENKVTAAYLDKIPFREAMRKRLEKLWNHEIESAPFKKGDYWYFYRNSGLQAQNVLYQADSLGGEARVFIDPNTFSEDGTVALGGVWFNKEGSLAAYTVSTGGSDWQEIFVIDTKTGKKTGDHIKWVKFSGVTWLGDGFYYGRYPEPADGDLLKAKNLHQMIYHHKLGTPQSADSLVFKDDEHPDRMYFYSSSKDQRFLFLGGDSPDAPGNVLYYKRAGDKDFIPIEESYDYSVNFIGNIGDTLYIQTNKGASKYKVFAVSASDPRQKHIDILPESDDLLQGCNIIGDYLFAVYLHDASSRAFVFNADGSLKNKVDLPAIGSMNGFSGDEKTMTLFYRFSSFTIPGLTYRYDVNANKSTLYKKSDIDFNPDDYITKQVFYKSKDGTRVPMFIVHKKGIKLDGKNPTMLYGYGGFNISLTPSFAEDRILWLEKGGVYAMPNIRGGGEYGEAWHKAGTKLNKKNVFDDFIAAAEYLIKEGYTSSPYLAISGRSNGGLLVGAVMTQRPDLMRVAFPGVGVLDMLRYQKFTIGYYWADDYGTSDDSIQFQNLIKYSPLHNLRESTCYPSTLIVTADHDDRVFPAHSFKFAARLQEVQGCDNPVLIRIDHNAGHGAGKPTAMIIQDKTDMWAFAFYEMGIDVKY